jgi:hypothetical protein
MSIALRSPTATEFLLAKVAIAKLVAKLFPYLSQQPDAYTYNIRLLYMHMLPEIGS